MFSTKNEPRTGRKGWWTNLLAGSFDSSILRLAASTAEFGAYDTAEGGCEGPATDVMVMRASVVENKDLESICPPDSGKDMVT